MKSLSYLNKYFFKYKWRFLLGILFIGATNFFKVELTELFGDKLGELEKFDQENEDILYFALIAGGKFILLSLIAGIFLFMTRQTIIIMSRLIEFDLKNEIYQKYQRLSFNFYSKNSTGDLMNRISEDVSKVRMYLGPGVMYSINLAILSFFVIRNMLLISPELTVYVLIPLPIMSLIIYKVSSRIGRISGDVQKKQSSLSTIVQETFSGIRIIKAYEKNKQVESNFNKEAKAYKTKSMELVLTNALFMPTIFILIGLSTILCIYIGGKISYEGTIYFKDIVKFIFYVNMLTWPFASIGWVSSLTQRAAASQERINEFLNTEIEINNDSKEEFDFEGPIEFRNVSFEYKSTSIEAIKNLSFSIKKGETLGIIGGTGSGKSTILRLLMREIDPDEGEILVNNIPLKKINLEAFRNQTGTVPQDVFLFSESIKDNLLFGTLNNEASDEKIEEVTKLAHVYHNIVEFKNKFDTLLGERGVNLSGGQKQRLSIARALIREPKLLLLDDCLSAVDTKTEDIILRNLNNQRDLTSIIISHRISTIRNASKIIFLHNGEITESGTNEELIAVNGEYNKLLNKQLSEDESNSI